eukprot:5046325-Prymnesium_polylepis.1
MRERRIADESCAVDRNRTPPRAPRRETRRESYMPQPSPSAASQSAGVCAFVKCTAVIKRANLAEPHAVGVVFCSQLPPGTGAPRGVTGMGMGRFVMPRRYRVHRWRVGTVRFAGNAVRKTFEALP